MSTIVLEAVTVFLVWFLIAFVRSGEADCHELRFKAREWLPRGGHNESVYNDADHIIDGVYLGNICAARNRSWLHVTGVQLVINVAEEWDDWIRAKQQLGGGSIRYRSFPFDDVVSLDQEVAFALIDRVARLLLDESDLHCRYPILVHCNMGISRSASVVIRYLQLRYAMSYREALRLIRSKRSVATPNSLLRKILWQHNDEL